MASFLAFVGVCVCVCAHVRVCVGARARVCVCPDWNDTCASRALILRVDCLPGSGVEEQGSDRDETYNGGWVCWR